MVKGGALAAVGVVLTVVQMVGAAQHGVVRVWVGAPVVFGVAWFLRGWTLWRRLNSRT
jgi:hypothetical protein